MTVVLFDIDGTLITTGGVGRQAIEKAFDELYGDRSACAHFSFDGMTDRAIMRQGLGALGLPYNERAVDTLLETYLTHLETTVSAAPEHSYRVHAGMPEAIARCEAAGFAVGLGTGNVREGARLKLSRLNLFERFKFGGFGDDHEARDRLLHAGAERGARLLGRPLADTRVVVIGDSPRDVAAARAIGAACVGVGTGSSTAAELLKVGATLAFDSLDQLGALDAVVALGGQR